jgi:hypothetical protein
MKQNLLAILCVVLCCTSSLFAQTVNGPGSFETYTKSFNNGSTDGWAFTQGNEAEWLVTTNEANGKDELHYTVNGLGVAVYDDATFENYSVTVKATPQYGNMWGIVFNYQDADNFYIAQAHMKTKFVFIIQIKDGVSTSDTYWYNEGKAELYNNAGIAFDTINAYPSNWIENQGTEDNIETMTVKNMNGKTTLIMNGQEMLVDVQTSDWTNGKVGVYTHWCPTHFDGFKVESLGTGSGTGNTGFETYKKSFNDGSTDGWAFTLGNEAEWLVTNNEVNGKNELHYTVNGMGVAIYDEEEFENYSVTVKGTPQYGNMWGIVFNYQDAENFYIAQAHMKTKFVFIIQIKDGVSTSETYWYNEGKAELYNNAGIAFDTINAYPSNWIENQGTEDNIETMTVKNMDGKTTLIMNGKEMLVDVQTTDWTSGKVGVYTHWCPTHFDGFIVESIGVNAVSKIKKPTVKIYPNPASDVLNIDKTASKIDIYNTMGVKVRSVSKTNSINISDLKKGIYFVNIDGNTQRVIIK